jgi:hypothetical protein
MGGDVETSQKTKADEKMQKQEIGRLINSSDHNLYIRAKEVEGVDRDTKIQCCTKLHRIHTRPPSIVHESVGISRPQAYTAWDVT